MYLIKGTLLDVDTSNPSYPKLIFESTRFDRGLNRSVPCSEQVLVPEEQVGKLAKAREHIGKDVAVPVAVIKTKNNKLMTMVEGELRISVGA